MPDTLCDKPTLSQDEYIRMPWKNGLGETLEIQKHEDEKGIRFRISQASVKENGVFSDFSGLDRTLVLLSGYGMKLEHQSEKGAQKEHLLSNPLDIARFSGGDKTMATLNNGSIEDLNIMVREADTMAEVTACFAPYSIKITSGKKPLFSAFYANEACQLRINETSVQSLQAHSTKPLSPNEALCLIEGSGVLIDILSTKVTK